MFRFWSSAVPVDCTADNQFNITGKRPVDRWLDSACHWPLGFREIYVSGRNCRGRLGCGDWSVVRTQWRGRQQARDNITGRAAETSRNRLDDGAEQHSTRADIVADVLSGWERFVRRFGTMVLVSLNCGWSAIQSIQKSYRWAVCAWCRDFQMPSTEMCGWLANQCRVLGDFSVCRSLKARTERRNWTGLNWHSLVFDELINV